MSLGGLKRVLGMLFLWGVDDDEDDGLKTSNATKLFENLRCKSCSLESW